MKNVILLTLILAGLNTFAENSNYYVSYNCPDNYVRVPALEGYTKNDFCVMKYEAKNDGSGNAISQASGTPYVNINRDDSIDKCTSLGEGYDLITNDEWQTIARNIELVPDNWSEGLTGGREELNRGHSETGYNRHPNVNTILYALEASSDDTKGCEGTEQTCSNTVWNSQRRTHMLSNGEVIWDIAGNVSEWVKDRIDVCSSISKDSHSPILIVNSTDKCVKSSSNGTTAISRTLKGHFGPSENHVRWYERLKLNSAPLVNPELLRFPPSDTLFKNFRGFGFITDLSVQADSTGAYRGGDLTGDKGAGVFAVNLNDTQDTGPVLGFRCVFHP